MHVSAGRRHTTWLPHALRRATAILAAVAVGTVIPMNDAEGAGQSPVLINKSLDTQGQPVNFGFSRGANVTGGVLNLTVGISDRTTSVEPFAAPLLQERTVDLSFDWKTSIASNTHKTGTELRDSNGNHVFAIAATAAELRNSLTEPAADSTSAPDSPNPTWTKVAFDRTKWYAVNPHIDFVVKTVQHTITTKGAAPAVMASGTARTTATNLAKMVACDYYGTGVQAVEPPRL